MFAFSYYHMSNSSIVIGEILFMLVVSFLPVINVLVSLGILGQLVIEGFSTFINYVCYHDDRFTRGLRNLSKSIHKVLFIDVIKPRGK